MYPTEFVCCYSTSNINLRKTKFQGTMVTLLTLCGLMTKKMLWQKMNCFPLNCLFMIPKNKNQTNNPPKQSTCFTPLCQVLNFQRDIKLFRGKGTEGVICIYRWTVFCFVGFLITGHFILKHENPMKNWNSEFLFTSLHNEEKKIWYLLTSRTNRGEGNITAIETNVQQGLHFYIHVIQTSLQSCQWIRTSSIISIWQIKKLKKVRWHVRAKTS